MLTNVEKLILKAAHDKNGMISYRDLEEVTRGISYEDEDDGWGLGGILYQMDSEGLIFFTSLDAPVGQVIIMSAKGYKAYAEAEEGE